MAPSSATSRDRERAERAADAKRRRIAAAPEDPEWTASGDAYASKLEREERAKARAAERRDREQFDAGRRAARSDAKTKSKTARRSPQRSRRAKTTARKVAGGIGTAQRSGSVESIVIGTITVALLYVLLQNATKLAGFLGGLSTALTWLKDPHTTIKFKE